MRVPSALSRFSLAVGLAVAGSAGAATSLVEITDAPERFANTDVTIDGEASAPKIGYLRESLYQLHSEGRVITVFSPQAAPQPGEHLAVSGTIGFKEGDEEFTWPAVLFETSRRRIP